MTSTDNKSRSRKVLLWTVLALILIASVLAGGWLFDHGGKFRNPDPARGSQVTGNQPITNNRLRIFTQPILDKTLTFNYVCATVQPRQHTKA